MLPCWQVLKQNMRIWFFLEKDKEVLSVTPKPNAFHQTFIWAYHTLDNFAVQTDTKTWRFVTAVVHSAFILLSHNLYSLVPQGQSWKTCADLRLRVAIPVAFHYRCTGVVPALSLSSILHIWGKACWPCDFCTLYRWMGEWIPMAKLLCFLLCLISPSSHKAFLVTPVCCFSPASVHGMRDEARRLKDFRTHTRPPTVPNSPRTQAGRLFEKGTRWPLPC